MNTLNKQLFIKLSCLLLTLASGAFPAQSTEEPKLRNTAESGHKRPFSQIEQLSQTAQAKETIFSHPEIVDRIYEHVQFYELCSLELVCKTFASCARNAIHYEALVFDHKNENGWENINGVTLKDKFILLKKDINFSVHLAELWLNHFPFNQIKGRQIMYPEPYYWDKPLTAKKMVLLNTIFRTCYNIYSTSYNGTKNSFYYKSLLGRITTERYGDFLTNCIEHHLDLTAIISEKDKACLPETKISAQLKLASMDQFGQGGPVDYVAARRGYNNVINNNAADPLARDSARFCLAEIDRLKEY
jgi:hypothetical protein